jgi:hypothetical protein
MMGQDPSRWSAAVVWIRTHKGLVVALVIPFALFASPQVVGRSFLDGDNFLQNFPMRVLVGQDLAHGVAPLWNPYLFSGTPLLGGFNAGAAYPTTWLMAILPIFTAWWLNLALAYDVALLGTYLFLRRQQVSSTAATFGAVTFAFAGYMTAQIVHIDLIEGAAWLPWMLLAIHALTDPPDRDGRATGERTLKGSARLWVAVLGIALGLSVLTGSAEAIIDSAVLLFVYLIGRLITSGYLRRENRGRLTASLVSLVAGTALGLALGAAQWMPGLEFLSQSQRSAASYGYFTSEPLPARLITLLASPFILGSNQTYPGTYAGPYNFPEVTSYMGILALIAACSLFIRKFRTRPEARHWWVWYVIAGVGLLSALGAQTPFGHVLFLIPGLNSERLLNRNLLLVDFSLAVLVAWWVHVLLDTAGRDPERPQRVASIRHRWRAGDRAEIVLTSAPFALIALLCLALWIAGGHLQLLLQRHYPVETSTRLYVSLLVTAGAAIAGWATWIVLHEGRYPVDRLRCWLTAVLVVDLALFNVFVIHPPVSDASAQAQSVQSSKLAAHVGNGRFIIYDPDEIRDTQLYRLGQTDLNLFTGLASGQGYTALTDGTYVDATGAHYQEDLDPTKLAGPTWNNLNVTTLLSLPGYFLTPIAGRGPTVTPHAAVRFPQNIDQYNSSPAPVATSYTLSAGESRHWYFGAALQAYSFSIPLLGKRSVPGKASGHFRVGVVTTNGGIKWLPAGNLTSGSSHSLDVNLPGGMWAAGLVVASGTTPLSVGTPTAFTAQTGEVALNGRLQYGVTWPHWKFTGTIGSFGVFHNTQARGWAWVEGPAGGKPAPGSSVPASDESGSQQITVRVRSAALLVRSESYSSGWKATITPLAATAGPVRSIPVVRVGVTQGVELPAAGKYLVSFNYRPASAQRGLVISAGVGVGLVVWLAVEIVLGRRRRRARRRQHPA